MENSHHFFKFTSTDLLTVSIGLRSKSALMVTFLPDKSWGTRHECEHTPPQPYSRLPESTFFLSAFRTVKVGPGGVRSPPFSSIRYGTE